jgi:chitin synthase
MLFHRLGTLSHILASTDLNCCSKKDEFLTDEALIEKNAVEIVKQVFSEHLKIFDYGYMM